MIDGCSMTLKLTQQKHSDTIRLVFCSEKDVSVFDSVLKQNYNPTEEDPTGDSLGFSVERMPFDEVFSSA